MLGKLIKHEFAATGRIMLPALAAVTGITLLANLMLRFGDVLAERLNLLSLLMVLVVSLAVIAVIAAEIMTIVLMVLRFHRNLLGSEGYLMHTLPVNVHQLVWSKLIVSCAWIVITNLLVFLLVMLSVMFVGKMNLGEILRGFPSWKEIGQALRTLGISHGSIIGMIASFVLAILFSLLASCLHFYAAMALGHMFTSHKGLLSVVFFVALSYLFSALTSALGVVQMPYLESLEFESVRQSLQVVQAVLGEGIGITLLQGALFYVATVLGLKKGLNLA